MMCFGIASGHDYLRPHHLAPAWPGQQHHRRKATELASLL